MDLVEQLDDPAVPIVHACSALEISRATLYRQTQSPNPPTIMQRGPHPRRLGEAERQAILNVLHSERFADQPPPEVYATLLSQGVYLASIRTMYRLLDERNETAERRAQRRPAKHTKPSLSATAPNQVWTWDITKLRGPMPGVFYFLYMVIDLFSRMVVGWLLAERESAAHAEQLFADTVARHGIAPGALTVHADRGSPMRSDGLAQLLSVLGVARSFSRPHVSDDNAFSEAHFKTLKYQPDYPGAFASPVHARGWCQEFIGWYNDEHQHSGLALFAPADVFYGRVEDVARQRQAALDAAYAAHPERFPNGSPKVARPPAVVSINPAPAATAAPATASTRPEPAVPATTAPTVLPAEASASLAVNITSPARPDTSLDRGRLDGERTRRPQPDLLPDPSRRVSHPSAPLTFTS
jgi:transposase InsO family protein